MARPDADGRDRQVQADVLRDIATRATAANIRNWCLTKARDVDGTTDLSRLRVHGLRVQALLAGTPRSALNVLRVMLDPRRAADIDLHIAFSFADGGRVGLHVRNGASVVTDGEGAAATVQIAWPDLAELLAGQASLSKLMSNGRASIEGDVVSVRRMLGSYDIPGFTA